MANQSQLLTRLSGWHVRVALVAFWAVMIGWTSVQMITGVPEVYRREHLGMLLGEIGALLVCIAGYLLGSDRSDPARYMRDDKRGWLSFSFATAGIVVLIVAFVVSAGKH